MPSQYASSATRRCPCARGNASCSTTSANSALLQTLNERKQSRRPLICNRGSRQPSVVEPPNLKVMSPTMTQCHSGPLRPHLTSATLRSWSSNAANTFRLPDAHLRPRQVNNFNDMRSAQSCSSTRCRPTIDRRNAELHWDTTTTRPRHRLLEASKERYCPI